MTPVFDQWGIDLAVGFDREKLKQLLQEAGFGNVRATTASVIGKEVAGQSTRGYPIFLITATRRAA